MRQPKNQRGKGRIKAFDQELTPWIEFYGMSSMANNVAECDR